MITQAIFISILLALIIILFHLHKNYTKPVYNKIHNVWEEDPTKTEMANGILVVMLLLAFFVGLAL